MPTHNLQCGVAPWDHLGVLGAVFLVTVWAAPCFWPLETAAGGPRLLVRRGRVAVLLILGSIVSATDWFWRTARRSKEKGRSDTTDEKHDVSASCDEHMFRSHFLSRGMSPNWDETRLELGFPSLGFWRRRQAEGPQLPGKWRLVDPVELLAMVACAAAFEDGSGEGALAMTASPNTAQDTRMQAVAVGVVRC